jgi:hypothetical protein
MKERLLYAFVVMILASLWSGKGFPALILAQEGVDVTNHEAGGEDLRIETRHGPIHVWRPENYDSRTAGLVIYVHGYFTSVDQTWTDDHLAAQFRDSSRNALFIAIEAPQSMEEDVSWKSLEDLLRTVEERAPFSLPRGPLVIVGHSAAYRTILMWLHDPRIQGVILLDALYTGEAEFRLWLLPRPHTRPRRMVLVAYDTWPQSNHFSRHIYGTARRRSIPANAAGFTPRENQSRLLFLRSQYDHNEMINNGKVIPVLLQISPLRPLHSPKPHSANGVASKPIAYVPRIIR